MTITSCSQVKKALGYPEELASKLPVLYTNRATLAYCGYHSLEDLLNIKLVLDELFLTSYRRWILT